MKEPGAFFIRTQIEVGTGHGYRWAQAVYIVPPEGGVLYPPVRECEARAICKREGWTVRGFVNQNQATNKTKHIKEAQ